jgi:hypothetical protein
MPKRWRPEISAVRGQWDDEPAARAISSTPELVVATAHYGQDFGDFLPAAHRTLAGPVSLSQQV